MIPISKGGTGVTTLDELKAIMKSAADYSDMHETVSGTVTFYSSYTGNSEYGHVKNVSLPTPSFPWKSFSITSASIFTITDSSSTSVTLQYGSSYRIYITITLDTTMNTLSYTSSGSISVTGSNPLPSAKTITIYGNG